MGIALCRASEAQVGTDVVAVCGAEFARSTGKADLEGYSIAETECAVVRSRKSGDETGRFMTES